MRSFEESVAAISNSVDFTKFGEKEVEDLFLGSETLFDDLGAVGEPQPINTVSCGQVPVSPQYSYNYVVSEDEETSSTCSDSCPGNNLVNIVMILDPSSEKVTCPEQVLSYNAGNGQVEKMVFGPTVLNALPQEMLNLATMAATQQQGTGSRDVISPPATPTRDIMVRSSPAAIPVTPPVNIALRMPTTVRTTAEGLPPLRALSAYNFYFRDERDRILNGGEHEWTIDKQRQLLAAHWSQDRTKKRRHRKSHGKIDFTSLSRLISSRWKELPDSRKDFYRQVASQDWERFQRELDECKKPADGAACDIHTPGLLPQLASSSITPSSGQFQTVIG